jgi:nucleoside-diphosphate-sugar epimerase
VALEGVDTVIHTAARVHVLHGATALANLYTETNERGTQCLADAAAKAQVRRFVFLSSVKVSGEETLGVAYSASDTQRPNDADAYAISNWHAEQHIIRVAARSSMEAVIVRSRLVYGPGVRANFLRLMRWVDRGWPLPLGAVQNKRSHVNGWNLCDLLLRLIRHPSASRRTWMLSDAEDLSTADLLHRWPSHGSTRSIVSRTDGCRAILRESRRSSRGNCTAHGFSGCRYHPNAC